MRVVPPLVFNRLRAWLAIVQRLAGEVPAAAACAEVHPALLPPTGLARGFTQTPGSYGEVKCVPGFTLIAETNLSRLCALTKVALLQGLPAFGSPIGVAGACRLDTILMHRCSIPSVSSGNLLSCGGKCCEHNYTAELSGWQNFGDKQW